LIGKRHGSGQQFEQLGLRGLIELVVSLAVHLPYPLVDQRPKRFDQIIS
jgi:hypothetical protein